MKVKYETTFCFTIYKLINILNSEDYNQDNILNKINSKRECAFSYLKYHNYKNTKAVTKIKSSNVCYFFDTQVEFEELKNILLTIIKLSEDMLDNVQFQTEGVGE